MDNKNEAQRRDRLLKRCSVQEKQMNTQALFLIHRKARGMTESTWALASERCSAFSTL